MPKGAHRDEPLPSYLKRAQLAVRNEFIADVRNGDLENLVAITRLLYDDKAFSDWLGGVKETGR